MKEEKELSLEEEVTRDCPILFQMRSRPCSETTMCWGFECGEGWHRVIASACRELEMYNTLYYPKYRVRIQADQIKEKFGTLHFYWSVATDPNKLMTWIGHKFEAAYDWLDYYKRFDYKMKRITDVEPYDYDNKEELTEEEYRRQLDSKVKCSNVELKEVNGKYIRISHLHNYGRYHMVPSRLKLLWHVKNFCYKARNWFLYSTSKKDNAAVRNCIEYLYRKTEDIVRKAEQECEEHCEMCGHQIGTKWSPTCVTTGWIKYICDECAEKQTGTYVKNGELWQGDKMLKSKEEMEKNRKETEDEEV